MGGRDAGAAMTGTLVCLGYGYCARHYVPEYGKRFDRIIGTAREPRTIPGIEMLRFDPAPGSALRTALTQATHLLISAAPGRDGDPVLYNFAAEIAAATDLQSVVYLSSLGVYGNHDCAWIDEDTPPQPNQERGGARLKAETDWLALGDTRGVPVAVLRLAGIYGPGQSVLQRLREGRARRIAKPGQVFNRIHVADIAQVIDAVL